MGVRGHSGVRDRLCHVDADGSIRMVDVSDKLVTERIAVARGRITIGEEALTAIRSGRVAKGDPLQAARLAGVMGAKRTAELIPLCHPLMLLKVDITFHTRKDGYDIEALVRTSAQTGVEMEALTAVSVAALTIYDMMKALDKKIIIGSIRLIKKTGGRSGLFEGD